jgi:hypothetical protein
MSRGPPRRPGGWGSPGGWLARAFWAPFGIYAIEPSLRLWSAAGRSRRWRQQGSGPLGQDDRVRDPAIWGHCGVAIRCVSLD